MERDELTGLLTTQEFLRRVGESRAGALLHVDVDALSFTNYVLGHVKVDPLLTKMGGIVSTACPGALVARVGGGEFVVFTEDANNARSLAEDIRSAVANQFHAERRRIRAGASDAGVVDPPSKLLTVSIGVAVLHRHADLNSALRAAVDANDSAKAAGRDCVVSAGD